MKRTLCAALALGAILAGGPAFAQSKINLETTAGAAGAALFAAKGEGYFEKHGLDVNVMIVNLMPNFPPALVAGSADVGFMVTTTFLQAIDGGLDLVAFVGGSVTSHRFADTAAIAAAGTNLKTAQDFIGKKVGVPGIGATLQVMFRYWLMENGVDFEKVNFAEVSFPTMRDTLSSKSVDAVVATDPFIAQMTKGGIGYPAVVLNPSIPEGKPLVMYTATRIWADAHPKEIIAFREAITEGAAFAKANPDKTRDDINVYAKLPVEIMKNIEISEQEPKLETEQVAWWVDVMKKQKMLTTSPDVAKLIVK